MKDTTIGTVEDASLTASYGRDGNDDIGPRSYRIARQFRHARRQARVRRQCQVSAFNEAVAPQFIEKNNVYRVIARRRKQATQTIGPPRFLRQLSERPRDT